MPRNSPEAIAKARAKNIGRKNTPETLAKMSAARKKYWEAHPERKGDVGNNLTPEIRSEGNRKRWRTDRKNMLEYARMGAQIARLVGEEWARVYYSIPDVREWQSQHSWAHGAKRADTILKILGRQDRLALSIKMRGRIVTPDTRKKLSAIQLKLWRTGRKPAGGYGKRSIVTTDKAWQIPCDSTYEARFVRALDKDPSVEYVGRVPFTIQYAIDGISHTYIPDFFVSFMGGGAAVVEVKPRFKLQDPIVIAKADAAQAEMERTRSWGSNVEYIIVTERDIELLEERA